PGVPPKERKHSRPLSIQQIFAAKKKDKSSTTEYVPSEVQQPPPVTDATKTQNLEISDSQTVSSELSPDLIPEEISLLATPKKDSSNDAPQSVASQTLVKRDAKKTSAQEASLTYLAVSIASSPVPKVEDVDENGTIENQVAHKNNMMREAMLRRVNRLRW
ncbi:MAG: hypothetical protein JKX94_02000, partial [Sneathiella sp.]|nr:hypothetical protein [Sneathiella sp.]